MTCFWLRGFLPGGPKPQAVTVALPPQSRTHVLSWYTGLQWALGSLFMSLDAGHACCEHGSWLSLEEAVVLIVPAVSL